MEKQVTESWADKTYEVELTDLLFSTLQKMRRAQESPVVEIVRQAFSMVKTLAFGLVYSPKYNMEFDEKVKPVLQDLEVLLFGDYKRAEVRNMAAKYFVRLNVNNKTKAVTFDNIQNIIKELWEITYLIKQWGYDEGFFAVKPQDRRYGKDAVDSVMDY